MKTKIKYKNKVMRTGDHRKIPKKKAIEILIDRKLPKRYTRPVIYHEKVEDFFERKRSMGYKKAHNIAQGMEYNKFFKGNPKEFRKENAIAREIARRNHQC